MAYFFFLALVFITSFVNAAVPPRYEYSHDNITWGSASSACDLIAAQYRKSSAAQTNTATSNWDDSAQICRIHVTFTSGFGSSERDLESGLIRREIVEPVDSCVPPNGYDKNHVCRSLNDQVCESLAAAKNDDKMDMTFSSSPLPVSSGPTCAHEAPPAGSSGPLPPGVGCNMTFSRTVSACSTCSPNSGSGNWTTYGTASYSPGAKSCVEATAANAGGASQNSPDCKGFQGSVNGVSTCVASKPSNTVTSEPSKSSTSTDDGKGNTTDKSVDKKTTCTGDACVTTTTTTGTATNGTASGGSGTTFDGSGPTVTTSTNVTTATIPKTDFCKENPKSPQCKGATGDFGGACDGGFTCNSDDAVACAAATAVNKVECSTESLRVQKDFDFSSFSTAMGDSSPVWSPSASPSSSDVAAFSQSNPFGNGCPADIVVGGSGAVMSMTIPLSGACGGLRIAGQLAVAFTMVFSALWVIKGI